MNHLYPYVDRPWSLWFELHSLAYMQRLPYWNEYLEWLNDSKTPPVFMQDEYPYIKSAVHFPLDEISASVFEARGLVPYYASTVAYAITYAIHTHLMGDEVDSLAIYGIDMVKDTEYEYQRPNCEFLLGLAAGLGINVQIPEQSALLKSPWLYGYQEVPIQLFSGLEHEGVQRLKQLSDTVAEKRRVMDNARADYHTHQGAFQEQQYAIAKLRDIRRGAAYGRIFDGEKEKEELEKADP